MKHPLQTKEWGEFRKEWGNEIEFVQNNLIVFSKIPFTNFKIGTVMKGSDIARSDLAMYTQRWPKIQCNIYQIRTKCLR